jgi:hypothetical protein
MLVRSCDDVRTRWSFVPVPLRFTLPDRGAARFIGPLVFMAVGVGSMVWFHRNAPWLVGWQRYVPYAVGGIFVLQGVAALVGIFRKDAARATAERALEEHRDAPWRVRPEWRRNELGTAPALDRSLVSFAIVWNLFSWPLAFFLIRSERGSGDSAVWLIGLFPLIGMAVLGKVGLDLARMRKFGDTVFALDPMPYRLGRTCRGRIRARVPREVSPEGGFRVKVSCYRQRVRHVRDSDGGRKRRVERDLLWRDETRLRGEFTMDGARVEIPFSFDLPEDAPPSTPLKLDNRIAWEVSADADLPGLDFSARVEVPVFPAEPGSAGLEEGPTGRQDHIEGRHDEPTPAAGVGEGVSGAVPGDESPASPWMFDEPLTPGIRLVDEPDLFELYFTAERKRRSAVILGGLAALLLIGGVPMLPVSGGVGLVMLLMGAFMAFGTIQQATNDTVLRIGDGRVVVDHDGVGMPADVDVPVDGVEEVLVHLGSSTAAENARYTISLVALAEGGLEHLKEQADRAMGVLTKLGVDEDHPAMDAMREGAERPRVLVADDLADKDEADWLAARIRAALRRELARAPDAPPG